MNQIPVRYVGQSVANSLRASVAENLDRYLSGTFEDLVSVGNWSIPLATVYFPRPLSKLDPAGSPDAEIENSKKVWEALRAMTPALACEGRIWIRFSHVECLEYSRKRWIPLAESNESAQIKAIQGHFFAESRTERRDDHSISRLWWNSWIAHRVFPQDPDFALRILLMRSDIRSNFIERPWIFTRIPLAAGIMRLCGRDSWIVDVQENTRAFMRRLNLMGSGIAFEALGERCIDAFMDECASSARSEISP